MEQSKQAFLRLLKVLADADQQFLDPKHSLDEQGKVDGYQHLLHLLSYGVDFYLNNDPLNPHWARLASPYKKILGDNVDSVYHFSQLRGDQTYRIRGWRHNSCYMSFAVYGGSADGRPSERVCITINHNNIEFDDDGGFEIVLSPEPNGKNEFKLDEDAVCIISREYFTDPRAAMEAELYIFNTSEHPEPGPLSDAELAGRIHTVATFVQSTMHLVPLPVPLPINSFSPPFPFTKDQKSWGLTDNVYCFGRFQLNEDEYLEITFTSPPANYWGIQVWNHMMQSMDYTKHKVSINMHQSKANADGSYSIFVSQKPMDKPNWFGTGGYQSGVIFVRWLLPEGPTESPKVVCRKIL